MFIGPCDSVKGMALRWVVLYLNRGTETLRSLGLVRDIRGALHKAGRGNSVVPRCVRTAWFFSDSIRGMWSSQVRGQLTL